MTSKLNRSRLAVGLALLCSTVFPGSIRAEEKTGEQIYRDQCVRCHGPNGEGTKAYSTPLIGDRSIPQLARVIARTMPEDKPGTCVGSDADKVARYIYESFYSPTARERNKPARIELERLTVNQYRQSLADLVGSFRPASPKSNKQGLRAEYYNARNFQGNRKLIDRIDPQVKFDFGTDGPEKEKFDATQFCIRWDGSVLAPDTGSYEFVVRTEHALRLWVNDVRQPLIDGWVKSGNETTYRGSIFLLAGRSYPIRLEFSKAKQGVDDSQKNPKPPPVKASIELQWKPPEGVTETIPARCLIPVKGPEVYVVSTPFPPDDRSLGWERGTTISPAWGQAVADGAIDTSAYILKSVNELAGTTDAAKDRDKKVKAFARTFAERAFRRPLTDEQAKNLIDRQFAAVPDLDLALKRVVLLVLNSPRFLMPASVRENDDFAVAARLALALWDSIPDKTLWDTAQAKKLNNLDEVNRQAERMMADPRARSKIRLFLHHWLKIDQTLDVSKDPKRFPGFDPQIVGDLRTSLDLTVENIVWGPNPDFRQLLLSDQVMMNGRLAKFYGVKLAEDAPFQPVSFEPERRSGVLTHPYLLSAFAYTGESSPIHRGVFVARGVLGLGLRPPPEAVSPLAADLHPSLTTRERVTLQTKPQACQTCHNVINPLGFTLEQFDAIGRFRESDHGKPVDPSGSYLDRSGQVTQFRGPRELAQFLAKHEDTYGSFCEQLFHHLVHQPVRAYGPETQAELKKSLVENGYNIRTLARTIAVRVAMPSPPRPTEKTSTLTRPSP